MVLFGVPPEDYWPYTDDEKRFDKEPPAFCYAFAQDYQKIKYYRHDPPETRTDTILNRKVNEKGRLYATTEIRKVVKVLVETLAANKIDVDKIILYGSYAKGTPRDHSDIDIAVIYPSF